MDPFNIDADNSEKIPYPFMYLMEIAYTNNDKFALEQIKTLSWGHLDNELESLYENAEDENSLEDYHHYGRIYAQVFDNDDYNDNYKLSNDV